MREHRKKNTACTCDKLLSKRFARLNQSRRLFITAFINENNVYSCV